MPPFVRQLKPDFEDSAKDFWWQFITKDKKCLAMKVEKSIDGHTTEQTIYGAPIPTAPTNERRFQPSLIPGNEIEGIGGYNMRPKATRCFAFDHGSTGTNDRIVIAGCTLTSTTDRAFVFDFNRTGRSDHIVITRTGADRSFSILQNSNGVFATILKLTDGVAEFGMRPPLDRFLPVEMKERKDTAGQLVCYRPSRGAFWLSAQVDKTLQPVYTQDDPRNGVASFDFKWETDRVVAVDSNATGKLDRTVCFQVVRNPPSPQASQHALAETAGDSSSSPSSPSSIDNSSSSNTAAANTDTPLASHRTPTVSNPFHSLTSWHTLGFENPHTQPKHDASFVPVETAKQQLLTSPTLTSQ
ncbi:uncharacterized protein M421DRAFT_5277 [Didymella exigua CBS 183.55]|uniref:Uncharacterized protein n=1 Tax=Didymella exigua CBS 183.55 TaxID=1150837 RepID=A0A6A5RIN3_9PLEO|nr:uncharacterized protein M421DRAFT_5277 [Didymella exigua CBS 183.55]KAF1928205.1 hypothetical protein M421DRAFT_5277 [Didymella exigua CBS 183.55]